MIKRVVQFVLIIGVLPLVSCACGVHCKSYQEMDYVTLQFSIPDITMAPGGKTFEGDDVSFNGRVSIRALLDERNIVSIDYGIDETREELEIMNNYFSISYYPEIKLEMPIVPGSPELFFSIGVVNHQGADDSIKLSQKGWFQVGAGFQFDFPASPYVAVYYRATSLRVTEDGSSLWGGPEIISLAPVIIMWGFSLRY